MSFGIIEKPLQIPHAHTNSWRREGRPRGGKHGRAHDHPPGCRSRHAKQRIAPIYYPSLARPLFGAALQRQGSQPNTEKPRCT